MNFVVKCWKKEEKKIIAIGYRNDKGIFKILSFDRLAICEVLDVTPSQLDDLSEGIYNID